MHKIPLFKIYTDQDDVKAVTKVVKSGMYWAIGPDIEAFENALVKYVGTKYALAFNSGTSALHALAIAYGFKEKDEVIVPSFSFIATANTPLFVGAKPVFAEIKDDDFGLDPKSVEDKITSRTKAIIAMHYGGGTCDIQSIKKIAKKHKLILIEDAAESLGSKVGKTMVGNFGDSAIFSFCGPKVITTGEGGAITTNNKDLYEKLKLVRSHGRLETENYFSSTAFMEYATLGYNFRMSTMTAALGSSQLKKINKIISLRRKNAKYLDYKLSKVENIILPKANKESLHVYQMYTIIVKEGKAVRDSLKKYLHKKGIMAKIFFDPVHLSYFYRNSHGYKKGYLKFTENLSEKVLSLPMYPGLTKSEMDYMTKSIIDFFQYDFNK